MVVYDLQCPSGHAFEGWFDSAADFRRQAGAGQLLCPVCAAAGIVRVPSPSRLNWGAQEPSPPPGLPAQQQRLLRQVQRFIESHFEDVGRAFASEARSIHRGESEARAIRGQATGEEVRDLHAEGIETVSLPLLPPERSRLN